MLVYHNQPEFEQDKYGSQSIQKKSTLNPVRIWNTMNATASYTEFFVNKIMVEDEVDLIQLGHVDVTNIEQISNKLPTES